MNIDTCDNIENIKDFTLNKIDTKSTVCMVPFKLRKDKTNA